ncbi:MAG TPA: Arc family DNA-binding protein [Patescibacteria group bacterium]
MDQSKILRRSSINFPSDIEEVLKERAEVNRRSLTKEVVWIVEQFLKQEQQKEAVATASLKGENV